MAYTHERMIEICDAFKAHTNQGHKEARIRRNYVNNIQWSEEERATLERRKQPIVTDNIVKRKTDYFLGIERQTRSDPKAFPRTPEHEEAAEAFTDGIRYVCDNNDWDIERSEGFDTLIVEGIEGYVIPVENTPAGIEIRINHIPWDRIIYDIQSTDRYFRDSKYKGIETWMDLEDAIDMFPNRKDVLEQSMEMRFEEYGDEATKNIWSDTNRKRVKVIQLYYLEKGVWIHCIFAKAGFVVDPAESTYLDEFGRPDCNIEFASAYIDKDNDRFGPVQDMISLQDLVNKATSKYMHIVNTNQTWGNQRGPDANKAKKEAAKPDGHFEIQGDAKFGEDFGIIPTNDKALGTFNILQNAKVSLTEIGGNQIVDPSASGRSKEVDAQKKMIELGPILDTHRQCSKRVYRQVWNRIKQYWTDEKWVRVTDDENNLKFVMLNQPVTYRMALEEKFGQVPTQAENHPALDEVIVNEMGEPLMRRNDVAEIDVDIIVEESPDIINIQQEQFAILAKLAEAYGPQEVPFEEVLKLSSLRGKDAYIERTKGTEQEQQARAMEQAERMAKAESLAQAQAEVSMEKDAAEIKSKEAKAMKDMADAQSQMIENQIVQLELGIANG